MDNLALTLAPRLKLVNKLFKVSKLSIFPQSLSQKIYNIKTDLIVNSLQTLHKNLLIEYSPQINNNIFEISNIIWVCWFQGEENAPLLVKKCINNLRLYNSDNFEVKVITLDNYENYTTLPAYIKEKFLEGKISYTQLSDILRFSLLADHGGIWIDSTYLTIQNLPSCITESDFFSLTSNIYPNYSISKGRWAGNFLKFGKNDPIAQLFRDLFFDYWVKNDLLIDYFLIDYYFELLYRNFKPFQYKLNKLEKIGDYRHILNKILFKEVNDKDNYILKKDKHKIYKLTYKFDSSKPNKKDTYYQKFFIEA